MKPMLRVGIAGTNEFSTYISEVAAKVLILFAWAIPEHLARFPRDTTTLMGLLALRVEEALHDDPANYVRWKELCKLPSDVLLEVEVIGDLSTSGLDAATPWHGGGGGSGAWPGGGGGGSGGGGAAGGSGASGAIALLCYSCDWQLVDIELFVTTGEDKWICPKGVAFATVIAIGGGGAGGSSGPPRFPA